MQLIRLFFELYFTFFSNYPKIIPSLALGIDLGPTPEVGKNLPSTPLLINQINKH